MVPIICSKLPPEIRRNLAHVHTDPEWTLTDLQTGILTKLRVLESGESLEYAPESSDSPLSIMTTTSLFMGARKLNPRTPWQKSALCTYCNTTDHSLFACNTVTNPRRRMEIAHKGNLCFNCLGRHRVAQCRSKAWCKHCRSKHYSSLCATTADKSTADKNQDKQTKQESAPPPEQNTSPEDVTASLTVSVPSKLPGTNLPSGNTTCLLKTAIAEIRSGSNRCKA